MGKAVLSPEDEVESQKMGAAELDACDFFVSRRRFAGGMPERHANLAVALMFPIVGSSLTPL